MLIRKLIVGLLSFYFLEFNQYRSTDQPSSSEVVELFWEKKKQKEKKKSRHYDNRKWKKKKRFKEKSISLKGTHSKDRRYSNQKLLRRMFRNC